MFQKNDIHIAYVGNAVYVPIYDPLCVRYESCMVGHKNYVSGISKNQYDTILYKLSCWRVRGTHVCVIWIDLANWMCLISLTKHFFFHCPIGKPLSTFINALSASSLFYGTASQGGSRLLHCIHQPHFAERLERPTRLAPGDSCHDWRTSYAVYIQFSCQT